MQRVHNPVRGSGFIGTASVSPDWCHNMLLHLQSNQKRDQPAGGVPQRHVRDNFLSPMVGIHWTTKKAISRIWPFILEGSKPLPS